MGGRVDRGCSSHFKRPLCSHLPSLASAGAVEGRNRALIGPLTTIYLGIIATLIASYMVVEYVLYLVSAEHGLLSQQDK